MSWPILPAGRIAALDGLRGVAALVVMVHHALMVLPDFARFQISGHVTAPHGTLEWVLFETPLRLLWGGYEAVVVFFVLSGFVLALPWIEGRPPSYGRFLVTRICRIYLPYLVAMLLAVAAAVALGGSRLPDASVWVNGNGWTAHVSAAAAPCILFMLNNAACAWIDNPTWSLAWEMRVSFLFPLLVVPIVRWGIPGAAPVLLLLGIAAVGATGVVALVPGLDAMLNEPGSTFLYAGYFVVGILVARLRVPLAMFGGRLHGWVAVACLVLGLGACWVPSPVFSSAIVSFGAALLIVSAMAAGPPAGWLCVPAIHWLGRVSYSLYLVHVPLLFAGQYLLQGLLAPGIAAVLSVAASLLAAEGFHRAIERPSMRLGRHLASRMRAVARAKALGAA